MHNQYQNFSKVLEQVLGSAVKVEAIRPLSGGCINNALLVKTNQGPFFVKCNRREKHDMFLAEYKGLSLLRKHSQFVIPAVLGCEVDADNSYLILEFIEHTPQVGNYWEIMGRQLAEQHHNHADLFGLSHHNYIGSLFQDNSKKEHWNDFFIENRLEAQLQLAISNKLVDKKFVTEFRKIYSRCKDLFPAVKPSLLHGDLWSGNIITGLDGMPCLIDPAVYYGHPEMEIAFTRLFGGFDAAFYASYQENYPMEAGFDQRMDLYNLYPLLVHLNLFGASYLSGIKRIVSRFL
ncbi:fructosamine kinase family protein [Fulvivirgaceae bacterium BMA12]|uniref:Fructosamine kinase family protein n=1 Tax=Agaribacillus aureus TaxID=3051825 RepID=A0ABT8L3Z9_9BACT|nr:fructosamine kinase family protein [Fulvivirgaceae bacterium BMA12]